jgi:hypothetical protein
MSRIRTKDEIDSKQGRGGRRITILAAALLLMLLTLAFGGCGSDDESPDNSNGNSQDVFPPNIITDADIAATEAGTPERGLLDWWQAYQFADPATAAELTSKDTLKEVGEPEFAHVVETRGPGLPGIEILDVTEEGDAATVRVGVLAFQPEEPGEPPPREPTASNPNSFNMVKEDGKWVFATPEFIAPQIESLELAEKTQRQEEQQQASDKSDKSE